MRYNHCVTKRAGIYIHIPFCARKCTYCNFNTTDFFEDLSRSYTNAVAREIAHWGEKLTAPDGATCEVDTIYFGGGTPSIVEAEQIASLIEACREAFDVARDAEITIEINPSTRAGEKVAGWLDAGVNRASIGVQSFIDSELQSLSRTHSSSDARQTVESLRQAGFENISIDLIAGLPGQTLEDWEFNLKESLSLRPEHLSLYLLEVKEGTQLYSQIKRGRQPQPDDDLAAEMYKMICAATRSVGYEHYEISNFALIREGEEKSSLRSRHNMKYWNAAPFYGCGCGAHSYDGRARRVNVFRTESYIDAVGKEGCAIAERRELSSEDRAVEALFMGLRLSEGIDLEEFRREFDLDVERRYKKDLSRLSDAGLIRVDEGRLKLTLEGMLLSNEVFVSFV